jgi:putative adenylate-forming enzyme
MRERLSILRHYLAARRHFTRWKNRAVLEAWQDEQVAAHLNTVLPKSGYYREHFAGHSLTTWRELPISRKADLMGAFDDWNTAGISLAEAGAEAERAERSRDFSPMIQGLAVGMSSGTTGSRGVFLVSSQERQRWAGMILARALRGTLHQQHRAALFLRADSPLYQTVGSQRFSFSFFDLFARFEDHWPRLAALRPTMLAAPPSALVKLAQMPGAADLMQSPRILLSVADVLDDADREIIERGFACRVGQLYQATEGFLASTCPEGTLHWNEDAVVVQPEWIDAAKTRFHPIITDFRRTTQPILRYRLDDVIVAGEKIACPCGSIFGTLEKIEGRQDDVFYLPSLAGDGLGMIFPDFVRRALILALPPGVDYTVVQHSLNAWTVELSNLSESESVAREIAQLCRDLAVSSPTLTFAPWTAPPASEKRRRVRRAMPLP